MNIHDYRTNVLHLERSQTVWPDFTRGIACVAGPLSGERANER